VNGNRQATDLAKASIVSVLIEAIEANKRFAAKYKAAKSRDELILDLAEALVYASRVLMMSIQGKEDLKNPNYHLFCECLEINRKGLLEELGSKLSFEDSTCICDKVVGFACAVFSHLAGSANAKQLLLEHSSKAYLENLGLETTETARRLLEIAQKDFTARNAAEVLVCLNKKPWLIVETDDFADCWKHLTFQVNKISK
jgi:hypothetical protein